MFTVIGAIICGKMGLDLAKSENRLILLMEKIFLLFACAILGSIAGYLIDFIVCSFLQQFLSKL